MITESDISLAVPDDAVTIAALSRRTIEHGLQWRWTPPRVLASMADADTNDLLGVHIIGPHATEMIAEAGLARLLESTPYEMAITVHPHPTVSEVIGEAAHDLLGHAIHI